MNTRCPKCGTHYNVDPTILRDSDNMAQCNECRQVFNAVEHQVEALELNLDLGDDSLPNVPDDTPEISLMLETEEPQPISPELPFDIPEDLPTLEPREEGALDLHDSLHSKPEKRTPWWQWLLAMLLLLCLLAQIAWMSRADWMRLPQAQPLCAWLDCSVAQQRDVKAFRVIERQLQAAPNVPNALRLVVRFRNQADFAQALPQLQLSLFESSGTLLARRLFSPADYLFPAPAKGTLAQAQEVFTIELLFEDPGARASGFKIDFL